MDKEFHMFFDKEGNPIEFMQLAELAELPDYRYIAKTEFEDDSYVSTIWTGMNLHDSRKLIFETMFFPINASPEMVGRWETEDQARQEHNQAVAELMEKGYAVKM